MTLISIFLHQKLKKNMLNLGDGKFPRFSHYISIIGELEHVVELCTLRCTSTNCNRKNKRWVSFRYFLIKKIHNHIDTALFCLKCACFVNLGPCFNFYIRLWRILSIDCSTVSLSLFIINIGIGIIFSYFKHFS